MDTRNITISVVQDRSKIQTFSPTLFTMSSQQPTAEKSVQTHDSSGTCLLTAHPENTATEVANTLVSMATGRQRTTATSSTNIKQLNVISVPHPSSSLPVLSLDKFTTSHGVPTAVALANQAKLVGHQQENLLQTPDENEMSTDGYTSTSNQSNSTPKTRRTKTGKNSSASKLAKQDMIEPIQYGPIVVKPRKHIAPTLSNGRRSKDEPLPPEEDVKRKLRRDRNKHAAAKCRRKRNELREELESAERLLLEQQQTLERNVQTLNEQKSQLEYILHRHPCTRKSSLPVSSNNSHPQLIKTIPTTSTNNTTLLDAGNNPIQTKRVTINFSNPQGLLSMAPLTRAMSNSDGSSLISASSSVPMITIHILPEVAQALLGSTTVDRTKLVELLNQASNSAASATNHQPTDSMSTDNTG